MEKKPVRLYNVIFPFWLILFWPTPLLPIPHCR